MQAGNSERWADASGLSLLIPQSRWRYQNIGQREPDLRDEHHAVHVRPRHVVLFDRQVFRPPQHQVADVQAVGGHPGAERLQQQEVAR